MSDLEYARKLDELDRLLNDPDVPMQPDLIWSLLADVSGLEGTRGRASSGSIMWQSPER
ncbi:MAG TPA: peptide chain release factor 1 [Rhodopila sp.]|nr:peptide chain release factor 1 [Rhodopila sp.]